MVRDNCIFCIGKVGKVVEISADWIGEIEQSTATQKPKASAKRLSELAKKEPRTEKGLLHRNLEAVDLLEARKCSLLWKSLLCTMKFLVLYVVCTRLTALYLVCDQLASFPLQTCKQCSIAQAITCC